jgi:hypothetical protein
MKYSRSTIIILAIGTLILLSMISTDVVFRYIGEIYEDFASQN